MGFTGKLNSPSFSYALLLGVLQQEIPIQHTVNATLANLFNKELSL